MDVNQVRFGDYSIGSPKPGLNKGNDKAENNLPETKQGNGYKEMNPDAMFSAMALAGMHNKAQINVSNKEVNPADYLSPERIADIEATMAGFEAGVNEAVDVINADFPGMFTTEEANALAAKAFANA